MPHDSVNHPYHYTSHPSGVEAIQITEALSFNLGNAVKYVFRAEHKGNPLEDYQKAEWYLAREIAQGRPVRLDIGQNTQIEWRRVLDAEPKHSILGQVLTVILISAACERPLDLDAVRAVHTEIERLVHARCEAV